MNRFLLDTGIAFDYISRRHDVLDKAMEEAAKGHHLGISIPVLGELYGGVENSQSRDKNLQKLRKALAVWTVWPFTEAAAKEFGRLFAELKRQGRMIQQIDLQTAAIALNLGNCTVVTKDSDFNLIPGLSVVNWALAQP